MKIREMGKGDFVDCFDTILDLDNGDAEKVTSMELFN